MKRLILMLSIMLVIVLAVSALASAMDTKTSDRLSREGFSALKRGDLATTDRCLYEVATCDPYSYNGGAANQALGNRCYKSKRYADALAWFDRATRSSDRVVAVKACQSKAGIQLLLGDSLGAADSFLAAGQLDPTIEPKMTFTAARSIERYAQDNPDSRVVYKPEAARLFKLLIDGPDPVWAEKAMRDYYGIRYEALLDADEEVRKGNSFKMSSMTFTQPVFVAPLSEPWRNSQPDSWKKLEGEISKSAARASDSDVKSALLVMDGEILNDKLNKPDEAIEQLVILDGLKGCGPQRAWGRLTHASILQDKGDYFHAAAMYATVVSDFTDRDNFKYNNVRGLAMCLQAQCLDKLDRKAEARSLRQAVVRIWPNDRFADEARRKLPK